ncbi:MAG TPA: FkbM family methyltransferase [Capsulimonadaceae bacterium]|jgi:FkbM family methyltransferase
MTLRSLKAQYLSGELSKPDYIAQMYSVHESLFDYADLLRETDIREITIVDGEVLATTRQDGLRIVLNREDRRATAVEILNFGSFEGPEMDLLTSVLTDAKHMLDIGANMGWVSLTLGKRLPDLQIAAFEPIPSTFELLVRNLALNGVTRVTPNNLGMSNKPGTAEIYFSAAGTGNASLANVGARADVAPVTCTFTTVDTHVGETKQPVDFIKIDVEGAELLVIQGGMATIVDQLPILFIELLRKWAAAFGYHPNEVVTILTGMGYECYGIGKGAPELLTEITGETQQTNFLFVHPQKHADKLPLLKA